ncbi:winged helix-turn-helix domain-containing protein [Cedecea colo]|uniref:Winged helix family transcriptional regulator n=1 Tax=Cedecea colo TaxID=2552946 RepID=A0ABX0VS51_9ENTR|nr:winged helix-turn-helix domain-containing protein [Cedecea colo]NIY49075.1 winged helix family transcriptional regulator [Cedecea colo]
MRYNLNAGLIYNAEEGSLTLAGNDEPDTQLSITANALLSFFLHNQSVVSRNEVLKKVWDDNGFTSSNANLNQYLSMLRKTFRHYGIENVIITISRGYLQLNPAILVEALDDVPPPTDAMPTAPSLTINDPVRPQPTGHQQGMCWYMASVALLLISILLLIPALFGGEKSRPIVLTSMANSPCELLASDDMLSSVTETVYDKNFDAVRQRLALPCRPDERFIFFYGDKLQTNGLGRVFMAHCAMHENNAFSYCDNYFYYSWNPQ